MDTQYSFRDVARIFGLKESRLRYWAQTGFINPTGRHGGRSVYSFADLVEIKAAKELLDNGIPLQRVRRNLKALRGSLPGKANLLGSLRVRSDGDNLVVVEEESAVDPISGQLFLDFEIQDLDREIAQVLELPGPLADTTQGADPDAPGAKRTSSSVGDDSPTERSAYAWFLRGLSQDAEASREDEALVAYQRAVALDPGLSAAHTNIGNIYYRREDRQAALSCYETACALDPEQPEARYNLANIYEEEGELDMAIAEYRRALRLAPDFGDAHFNLALALEQVGGRLQARHHWRQFLELSSPDDEQARVPREIAQQHLKQIEKTQG